MIILFNQNFLQGRQCDLLNSSFPFEHDKLRRNSMEKHRGRSRPPKKPSLSWQQLLDGAWGAPVRSLKIAAEKAKGIEELHNALEKSLKDTVYSNRPHQGKQRTCFEWLQDRNVLDQLLSERTLKGIRACLLFG